MCRSRTASSLLAAPDGRRQDGQTVSFGIDQIVLTFRCLLGANGRIVGKNDLHGLVTEQLAAMFQPSGVVFQAKLHRQATEQMRVEFGPHPFGYGVDYGLADLAIGQRSGFPGAGREQPLVFIEVLRGRGKPRQEMLNIGL